MSANIQRAGYSISSMTATNSPPCPCWKAEHVRTNTSLTSLSAAARFVRRRNRPAWKFELPTSIPAGNCFDGDVKAPM